MKFILEMRLCEVYHLSDSLDDYLMTIEEHIKKLPSTQYKISQQRKYSDESYDEDVESELNSAKANDTFPRLLRGGFLITLWAVYEKTLKDIDELFFQEHNTESFCHYDNELNKSNHKNRDVIERRQLYFKDVLKIELCSDAEYQRLIDLYTLRNALVHQGGTVTMNNKEISDSRMKSIISNHIGVSLNFFNNLEFDDKCILSFKDDIKNLISGLIQRAKDADTELTNYIK